MASRVKIRKIMQAAQYLGDANSGILIGLGERRGRQIMLCNKSPGGPRFISSAGGVRSRGRLRARCRKEGYSIPVL